MTSSAAVPQPSALVAPAPATAPQVELVVPVRDEAAALERSITRLHAFCRAELPFSWRITIADNDSRDATPAIAERLSRELPGVEALHLDRSGRGRALRAAWSRSDAEVLAYMDVDLSTDLRALLPLLAPLVSGHSDLSIGTRLAHGARVVRGPKRELISQGYNAILRATLRARFSDAQCGFKAGRADVLRALLPEVRDEAWFFDTELLVLAQRRGLRVHEVPVDWVDDPDSRVRIVPTAVADLRGVGRLLLASAVVRFGLVGVASTLAYALVYLALRGTLGAGGANAVALTLTAVGNTAANRLFTFGLRERHGLIRDHAGGFAVFVLTLALTSAALAVLRGLDPDPSPAVELAVLVTASACATVTRYVALRSWVFRRAQAASACSSSTAASAAISPNP